MGTGGDRGDCSQADVARRVRYFRPHPGVRRTTGTAIFRLPENLVPVLSTQRFRSFLRG